MADTNSTIQTWQHNVGSAVATVALSADGETIVAGTLGKTIICLDGEGHQRWQATVGNQAWRIGLSADGQTIVVGTGSTRPWDMKGRGLYCFTADGLLKWQTDLKGSVWGLDVSDDGNTVAAGTDAKQLLCYDGRGQRLWQQDVPGWGWYAWVFGAAISADGQTIAAASADKRVRLLERSGLLLAEFRTHGDLYIAAISADGQVAATGDTMGYVYLLDRQGHLLWEERLDDEVWAVALSTDGQRLLVGAGEKEKHLYAYDLASRLLWRRYVEGSISDLALSANGQRVVAGTRDGGIYIFGQDGDVLHKAQAGKLVRQVAISATGEQIVAGSEDGHIYGFQLPPPILLPATPAAQEQSQPQPSGTVYNIHIEQATGLAIGDKAQTVQNEKEMSISATRITEHLKQLQILANQTEELVIELLENTPVDSRVDPTWSPSRWRQTDPAYKPKPRMEYFWRQPLPDTLRAKQSEARRLYNRWHYQASAIIASLPSQEVSRFENVCTEVQKFIDLEVQAPADAGNRLQLIANFRDQLERQRSMLEALIGIPPLKD